MKATREKGFVVKPNHEKELDVCVDADFAGNWDPKETKHKSTAKSRHGCFANCAGCPTTWKSQLQNEIALSSTES